MPRRKEIPVKTLSLIEIYNTINESFDRIIPTDFQVIDFGDYTTYRFQTHSNNNYDLEFHQSNESCNTELNNDQRLGDYIGYNQEFIDCYDIGFTLSSVVNKDDTNEYEVDTNYNEQYDVMGRVIYICKKIMNDEEKIKLFVIGHARRNRLDIYQKLFQNHLSDQYGLFYGQSMWHDGGDSLFIIRNKRN